MTEPLIPKHSSPIWKKALRRLRGETMETDLSEYMVHLQAISAQPVESLPDRELKARCRELKQKALSGASLDDLLIECFSLIREVSRRTIGLFPFQSQVLAGMAMHKGKVVELPTGEGKTLAAVFPVVLNSLTGRGVHVLTFNDYLARRDAGWMEPIYRFFDLRVGLIQEGMSVEKKQDAYGSDITYATAKEAGFDFLNDNITRSPDRLIQRPYHFALVDEADSILIDEARIPLVIAGVRTGTRRNDFPMAELVRSFDEDRHCGTDDEKRNVFLTSEGQALAEKTLKCGNLYASENLDILTALNCALHARFLLKRDRDYIVRDKRIEIVDEFTGRVVDKRHWPDGLQTAVEAKERLQFISEGSILGTITLQHYFRLFSRLCGMTATAASASEEFHQFYGIPVVIIPPNKPNIRQDEPDIVFRTAADKRRALLEEIRTTHSTGRPVLVGTADVAESESLAEDLVNSGVLCEVLNARNDEHEAAIIAEAGALNAVTISTNMAGRGTDIRLGGSEQKDREAVLSLGGLHVIGTNRHESQRIDRQLRGRAGRQGDPGTSRFFISLEDDLVVRYGLKDAFSPLLHREKKEGPLRSSVFIREISRAQRIIEGQNFEIRKTLTNYSSLIEKQRLIMQDWRRDVLLFSSSSLFLKDASPELYNKFADWMNSDDFVRLERRILLHFIDRSWADHLAAVQDLRDSIHLVKVGGQTPFEEFQKQATDMFLTLQNELERDILEKFRHLAEHPDNIEHTREDLKGPSGTWTYLINDDQFGWGMDMLQLKNLGFAAAAAALYGPLYLLTGILHRFRKKSAAAEDSKNTPDV